MTVTLGLDVDAGFVMGDRRNADGEGIEIVAIELRKRFEPRDPDIVVIVHQ